MRIHLLSPGSLDQRTGAHLYDARMVTELRERSCEVVAHPLDGRWPFPERAPVEVLGVIPAGEVVLADGNVWTGLGAAGAQLARRNPVVVLVHSPLYREAGGASDVRERERRALSTARAVVVTSPFAARDLGVEANVVPPGTDRARSSPGSSTGRVLCVATLTPRKGHRVLLEALAQLSGLSWTLSCAGAPRDPIEAARIGELVGDLGLTRRVELLGELDEAQLEEQYQRADLVVHAAWYEAWGMGIAEAIARRIPVVSTPAGVLDALPVPAAVRVPVGDPDALAGAIFEVLTDTAVRASLREAAGQCELPSWAESADELHRILAALR